MKLLIIIAGLLVAFDGWAYNETDLAKLKALSACESCDLSGANLSGADLRKTNFSKSDLREVNLREADLREVNLREADLRGADLKGANLSGAKYCKTQMPWGEFNNDC